jgi:hypothetical protein
MLCRYYRHMVEYKAFDLKLKFGHNMRPPPHGRIQGLRFKIKIWAQHETTATKAVAAQHSVAVRARKNRLILHGYLRHS